MAFKDIVYDDEKDALVVVDDAGEPTDFEVGDLVSESLTTEVSKIDSLHRIGDVRTARNSERLLSQRGASLEMGASNWEPEDANVSVSNVSEGPTGEALKIEILDDSVSGAYGIDYTGDIPDMGDAIGFSFWSNPRDVGNFQFEMRMDTDGDTTSMNSLHTRPGDRATGDAFYRVDSAPYSGSDSVTSMTLELIGGSGRYEEGDTLYISGLNIVRKNVGIDKGVVLFWDDDGIENTEDDWGEESWEIYAEKEVPVAVALNEAHAGDNIQTAVDAQEAGVEFALRPVDPDTSSLVNFDQEKSEDEWREILEWNKEWAYGNGLVNGINNMILYQNDIGPTAYDVIGDYFIIARTFFADPWHQGAQGLLTLGGDNPQGDVNRAESLIDAAANQNGVVGIYWHSNDNTQSEVESILDYAIEKERDNDIEILSPSDYWQRLKGGLY